MCSLDEKSLFECTNSQTSTVTRVRLDRAISDFAAHYSGHDPEFPFTAKDYSQFITFFSQTLATLFFPAPHAVCGVFYESLLKLLTTEIKYHNANSWAIGEPVDKLVWKRDVLDKLDFLASTTQAPAPAPTLPYQNPPEANPWLGPCRYLAFRQRLVYQLDDYLFPDYHEGIYSEDEALSIRDLFRFIRRVIAEHLDGHSNTELIDFYDYYEFKSRIVKRLRGDGGEWPGEDV